MYSSTSELIRNELTNNILQPIYNIFEDSSIAYKELITKEEDLFKGSYLSEFKGRLMNYIIKRSFDIDRIPKNFPFKVSAINMAYGQKRTELKRNNILLTLGKAQNTNTLPGYSKYKQEYAKGNSSICKQLKMNIEEKEINIEDIPYYGIITYNLKDDELDFLNIVIPSSTYNEVIDFIPITPGLKLLNIKVNDDTDERVLGRENIKKEVIDKIKKLAQETR